MIQPGRANTTIAIGAVLMLLGVLVGAFGAHALKARLTPEMLAVYQTGVQYHLVHALGLILIGVVRQMRRDTQAGERSTSSALKIAAILMGVGVVLFSGSLYALAITGVTILGVITPIGGLCFIAAWAMVAWHMLRAR